MPVLGWLWLASPFALIGLISHDPHLLALVAKHHRRCQIIGWSGAATMLVGVTLVSGLLGDLMFIVGTPLVGLAVWTCRDDGDDGNPCEVPPIDWDDFERSFVAHVRHRGRPPRRPRAPSAG